MTDRQKEKPTFLDVILGNYDPCPCGHHFGLADSDEIKRHYIAGHYDEDWYVPKHEAKHTTT